MYRNITLVTLVCSYTVHLATRQVGLNLSGRTQVLFEWGVRVESLPESVSEAIKLNLMSNRWKQGAPFGASLRNNESTFSIGEHTNTHNLIISHSINIVHAAIFRLQGVAFFVWVCQQLTHKLAKWCCKIPELLFPRTKDEATKSTSELS